MDPGIGLSPLEHLTPHDLVTYSRCPYEMELLHAHRATVGPGRNGFPRTPPDVIPLRHSPLFPPPTGGVQINDGRLDVSPADRLVYEDVGETGLPMLFPADQVELDARFQPPHSTLLDPAFGISGRPDFVVRQSTGDLVPVEYKSTHLFVGYHESHGRTFDVIQSIAECRLVHATFGRRPKYGLVLYGDVAGEGEHEGWVQVPYGDVAEGWLKAALFQIRTDATRAPAPAERVCSSCGPNREGLCRFSATRFGPVNGFAGSPGQMSSRLLSAPIGFPDRPATRETDR